MHRIPTFLSALNRRKLTFALANDKFLRKLNNNVIFFAVLDV